ncbi:MAG: hypothetical protein IJT65_05085 [Eubacterium sp.]|nr:hypothetical protein [Eubacterium sp.]
MAEISFCFYDCNKNKTVPESVICYELSRDISAACDALRITFKPQSALDELKTVKAFNGEELIFSGLVDTQREAKDKNGSTAFVYARSLACLLVDNEAQPHTYNNPSVLALFNKNAEEYGFVCRLENTVCNSAYRVPKGASRYGAINSFVFSNTGRNIIVTPNGELTTDEGAKTVIIDNERIIYEKRIINRGDALSRIDYKNEGDKGYLRHIKSRFFEEKDIRRSKKLNLSSYPEWQRGNILLNRIKAAGQNYSKIELLISGFVKAGLYAGAEYISSFGGSSKDYYISSVSHILGENGERTRITLNKNIDYKEINYVAE